ncbi:MAG: U32 family peptidase [Bacilli bacterium]|nr:U32 family peptidase [Bacilli bacterium]
MRENSKVLININNLDEINKFKEIGITNFLFALQDFSIGYKEYTLDVLKKLNVNIYLNINIIMDTKKIAEFKKIIKDLYFIKGIFFEDIGVYNLLKEENIPLFWNQSHFVINSISINSWLTRVDSAVLANELMQEEIKYILSKVIKPVVVKIFGYNIAMYSRRTLLTNYNNVHKLSSINKAYLEANNNIFIAKENNNGTVLFYSKPFNYYHIINELDSNKIYYYLFDASFTDYLKIINNEYKISDEKFLNNKTIYKLED